MAPQSFLRDVLSAWTPSGSLGHVFAGQYGGYLWPMGPVLRARRPPRPPRVGGRTAVDRSRARAQRVGHGAAARRAGRAPARRRPPGRRPALHAQPLRRHLLGRTSITLLATAALPWLLLCVHRGLRDPRGLWWPAAFALVLTSTGGGVNVAVTAWLLLGPALMVVYELGWGGVAAGAGRGPSPCGCCRSPRSPRCGGSPPCSSTRATAWTSCPTPSSPGTIWGTTSMPESLRLLGFWTSYIGVGYTGTLRSFQADAGVYLALAPVIVATLAIPALCLGSFAWTRRARYAPFFLALVLLGLLVMLVGFPEGAPLRRAATFTYNHVQAVHFLRTSYKAGPLVSLGLAGLGALGVQALRPRLRRAALVAGAALVAVACWPLARGVGLDRQLGLPARRARRVERRRPRSRPHAAAGPARDGPARTALRLLRLGRDLRPDPAGADRSPGGGALHRARSPTCAQSICSGPPTRWSASSAPCPASCGRCWTSMGVGAVVQGADDDRSRSGAVPASSAAAVLGRARDARPRLRPVGARSPARQARSSRRCAWRRSAAGTCPRAGWCACCRAPARRWSTARRRRSPTSPPSARCGPTARCATPATSTTPRCARRRRPGRRS